MAGIILHRKEEGRVKNEELTETANQQESKSPREMKQPVLSVAQLKDTITQLFKEKSKQCSLKHHVQCLRLNLNMHSQHAHWIRMDKLGDKSFNGILYRY